MSIVRKIVLGYVIIIFIPVISFGVYFYEQISGSFANQFVKDRQNLLEQAYSNMRADLTRIESIYRLLQYNPYITDYLEGIYESDSENVYNYLRYIDPLFNQSMFSNPEIESILIYKQKEEVFPITAKFLDRAKLAPEYEPVVQAIKPGKGTWIHEMNEDDENSFVFFQYLYDRQIMEKIGLLEIRINDDMLEGMYKAAGVDVNGSALLLSSEGRLLPSNTASSVDPELLDMIAASGSEDYFIANKSIVNQQYIQELGVRLAIVSQLGDFFQTSRQQVIFIVMVIAALLVLLSVIYYYLASSIVKRILRLARHMRKINDDNLRLILHKQNDQDEIGFLFTSYNAMIGRIDELINNVHRAELRNKEAAYKVLQAQIKPHFLYNTLETIRMMAEANDDKEVADISYAFGRLMRYSLSSEHDHTLLSMEIETAKLFLDIHQTRLGGRMDYNLRVDIQSEAIPCPRFILQPLVENIILHGMSGLLRPVSIGIAAEEVQGFVRIAISDNGAGIPEEKLQQIRELLNSDNPAAGTLSGESSMGLYNVSERIKAFYGRESHLQIDSEHGLGTTLTLNLMTKAVAHA
ncbi:two-component system sensor histidine kinase YesM [Paenibacillus phyllosphaerae]|uniref:histidine kinase n=1 Tax=Paenibacillus phyllosphaerae TaxID=274593 RepID=A0A7W5FQQ6_9BACL|nr:histidine kinase [Paenibacillus phyllosphaerae]MBB3113696.1 two-component system sensor histidine kinase YesM [Paenibacillus phyllosphaerae]